MGRALLPGKRLELVRGLGLLTALRTPENSTATAADKSVRPTLRLSALLGGRLASGLLTNFRWKNPGKDLVDILQLALQVKRMFDLRARDSAGDRGIIDDLLGVRDGGYGHVCVRIRGRVGGVVKRIPA